MKNEKMVSIILPVYNGSKYLEKSILSIINQTYSNWELIIVDDCSTDDSYDIAKSYEEKDSRIKVVKNNVNIKLPGSLNVGFSNAQGEYFTWTSDDNIYKEEAIQKMVSELDTHQDISMVYCDYTNINQNGEEIAPTTLSEPDSILSGNVCGACFLYRSEIASRIGKYDVNLFLAEDYDYWIRIYCEGNMKHVKENLYLYRRHEESLSQTKKDKIDYQTYMVLQKNFLKLYYKAKKKKYVYDLFDHMVDRAPIAIKRNVIEYLSNINRRYIIHIFFRNKGFK